MSDIERRMAEWRKNLWGTGPWPDSSQENFHLTAAEREAVEWASKTLCVGWHDLAAGDKQRTRDAAATLRGLLERL